LCNNGFPFWNTPAKLQKNLYIPNILGKKNAFLAKKITFLPFLTPFCVLIS
jgi:hypothetical protein